MLRESNKFAKRLSKKVWNWQERKKGVQDNELVRRS